MLGLLRYVKFNKKEFGPFLIKSLSQAVYFAMAFIPFRMSAVALITLITRIFAYQVAPTLLTFDKKNCIIIFFRECSRGRNKGFSFCQQCGIAKETVSLISLSQSYLQLEAEKYPV